MHSRKIVGLTFKNPLVMRTSLFGSNSSLSIADILKLKGIVSTLLQEHGAVQYTCSVNIHHHLSHKNQRNDHSEYVVCLVSSQNQIRGEAAHYKRTHYCICSTRVVSQDIQGRVRSCWLRQRPDGWRVICRSMQCCSMCFQCLQACQFCV